MTKGIKKIEWTGKGSILKNYSEKNVKAKIGADQFVYFKITEWYDGTTDHDKTEPVLWHFQTHTPRESVLKLTTKAHESYGIRLPKKLCGPFTYYLQASLPNLQYSKSAALAIGGWCEPKIISSAWATETRGEDVRKTHFFKYGTPIYLRLNTEGLNGANNLIIEVYKRVETGQAIDDDLFVKGYTQTPVFNGEVNIIITDTLSWYKGSHRGTAAEFYIKVKDPSTKQYIKDDRNDVFHARYLRIIDEKEIVSPVNNSGVAKLTTGQSKKYEKNAGTCKFTKIGVNYLGDDDLIFDEGKFIRKMDPKDNFNIVEQIHYDYDKWDIRNDAKPILDKVAVYLKQPPFLPVELGAHTDSRGTDEYNLDLSAKRADAVVNYLISKGVSSHLISGKGYGKTKPVRSGANLTEAQHQENRRTTLRFKIFENNAQTLVHDVIVPSYKKPADLSINIDGFIRKGCHKKKEHINVIKSYDSYKESFKYDLTENKTNYIDVKLNSRVPILPKITDVFSFANDYKNVYSYYLHSCAYYSGKDHPTFAINAYPDIVWIGHFMYNYNFREYDSPKNPYLFHDKSLELKNGIAEEIKELTDSIIGFILSFLPIGWLVKDVLLPYLESQAAYYDVGMHAIYDRTIEKRGEELSLQGTELDFIKTDATTRRIVAFIIYEMAAIGIVIDLLLILISEGALLEYKIARIVSKGQKLLEKAGLEIESPSIAINTGMYYKMQADRRMALIFEANIKADPLIGINFTKKYSMKSIIHQIITDNEKEELENNLSYIEKRIFEKLNGKLNSILAEMGEDDVKFSLSLVGDIGIQQNIQYNVLTEKYTLKDKFNNLPQKGIISYSSRARGNISFENKGSKKIFEFSPLETEVTTDITFKMACEALVITEYGYDKKGGKGLFITQKLKFSGLKGTFKGVISAKPLNRKPITLASNDGKPKDFTVLEGFTKTLKTIYLFNTSPNK